MQLKIITALFAATLFLCSISQAQMGTMKWKFKDRAAVRTAVRANAQDLSKSYNIILSARRQGMIRSAVQEYEALIKGKSFGTSPELSSSYAFAHHIMSAPIGWDIPFDKARGLVKDDQSAALKVGWYREQALKARPNSPEVLLEYAIWQFNQNGGSPRALRIMERVFKTRSNWADAYYWHTQMLGRYADNNLPKLQKEKQKPKYAMRRLVSLQKAEKLDSKLQDVGLSERIYIYGDLNKPKEALFYFDAYALKNPDFARYNDKFFGAGSFKSWRNSLVAKAKAAS